MRRPTRLLAGRSALLPAAAVAAMLVLSTGTGLASPVVSAPPDDAAAYLIANLTDGDHYEGEYGPEYGPTIDISLGLMAAGGQGEVLEQIAAFLHEPDSVAAYVHGVPFDAPDAVYAGATSKLGFFVSLTGGDPRDVAGEDLVETLLALEQPSGRFSDVSDYGDNSNVLTQSYAILSLTAAEDVEPSDAAVQFLLDAQCDDGSFTLTFDGGACAGSPDATGIAVQALNANDPGESTSLLPEREAALVAAAHWLEDAREADGSYLLDGVVNVNTTGYGGLGVIAAGLDASATTSYLQSVQLPDGGLPIKPGEESDVFATAQALPALSADSFLSLDPEVVGPAIIVPPSLPPTTSAPPTTSTTPTETPTATATGTLPPTGGSTSGIAALALALLAGGVVVLLTARRALTRP